MAANYFIFGSWILAVCMSISLAWIAERRRLLGMTLAVMLVFAPFVRLAAPSPFGSVGWPALAWARIPAEWNPFRDDRSWDDFGREVLGALPPRAVLLGNWHEGMPIQYARHVGGVRPDVDFVLTETPRDLERNAPIAAARGHRCFTTLATAPRASLAGMHLVEAGEWRRGRLWEVVPGVAQLPER
jgi:hypothetical protein